MYQEILNKVKQNKLILIAVAIIIIFVSVAWYYYSLPEGKGPVAKLKKDSTVAPLIDKLGKENSQEVFKAFDQLAKDEKDKSQAESLKLYAAASLINLDRSAGADYYIGIANDLNNTAIVRAYAMTQLSQYAVGDGNMNLLRVFFKNPEDIKKMTPDEIKLTINHRILETYSMPLAMANVMRLELKKEPTADKARLLQDIYISKINQLNAGFSEIDGLSHFLPATYLAMSDFYRRSEAVGVSSSTEVRSSYDKAYGESVVRNQTITKQFVMLHYADYLLSKKMTKEAETVLSQFIQDNLTEMIVKNLKSTGGSDYPNVIDFMDSPENQVAKDLTKKIGQYIGK